MWTAWLSNIVTTIRLYLYFNILPLYIQGAYKFLNIFDSEEFILRIESEEKNVQT